MQTVSREVVYLTRLFSQEASRCRKKCQGNFSAAPEYAHLLHAVFNFCHLRNGCKKLLKMIKGFRDLLTKEVIRFKACCLAEQYLGQRL